MVPEGWWQIRFHLEGYEDAASDWMCVSPPQTGINIGMISLEAPEIQSLLVEKDCIEIIFSRYMIPSTISEIVVKDTLNNDIAYTLSYNPEEGENDQIYTRAVSLRFNGRMLNNGETISLSVPDNALLSYANVFMNAADYTLQYSGDVELEGPDGIVLFTGENLSFSIQIINNATGILPTVSADNSLLVSITDMEYTNNNEMTITIHGEFVGETTLNLDIAGTDLTFNIPIHIQRSEIIEGSALTLRKSGYILEDGEQTLYCALQNTGSESAEVLLLNATYSGNRMIGLTMEQMALMSDDEVTIPLSVNEQPYQLMVWNGSNYSPMLNQTMLVQAIME